MSAGFEDVDVLEDVEGNKDERFPGGQTETDMTAAEA